jgi:DNA-binding NarL/FixJ family response regulator
MSDNELANRAIAAALRSTLNRDPYGTEHFSDCVVVPRSSGGSAYALQFSALGNHNEFSTSSAASAIVFLTDEAQEVADYLGTSFHTVRTQIKEIYTKLGVDSRARFTKLMLWLAKHRQ